MPSDRRVRFADDFPLSSDQPAQAAQGPVQNSQSNSHPPHLHNIEAKGEIGATNLEASLRAEHLVNVRLAEQRAHDAMMLARSLRADIRSNNAKQQSSGRFMKNDGPPKTKTILHPSDTRLVTKTETREGPLLDYFEILKNQSIMTVPVAWVTEVFHLS
jgi:hypothetical protein